MANLKRTGNNSLTHTSKKVPREYPAEGSIDSHHVSKMAVVSLAPWQTPLHIARLVKVGSKSKKKKKSEYSAV
jgi:hypothetical protein